MIGVGGESQEGAVGGERAAWEIQGRERDRQRETLGRSEGSRAENRGVGWTDGNPMSRECQGEVKYRRGRRWGVLRAN